MSTNTKIYTAAEVANAGISREEIDQALAEVTQKAYEAAKEGENQVIYFSNNLNILNEVRRYLKELGYTTKLSEKITGNHHIAVRWDNTHPTKENKK